MRREEPPSEILVDDRVMVGPSTIEGDGLFATEDVRRGTIMIRLTGRLVSSPELNELIATSNAELVTSYVDTITVYEDAHLVLPIGTVVHFANHSCDPNLWHEGPYDIAARRDLRAGEELTIDYGTHSGASGLSMSCACGSALCRGEISSDDWRRRELQARYRGHWVPALQERIDRS